MSGKLTSNFSGLHGDYLQGWTDQDRLEDSINTCQGDGGVMNPNCSLNVGPDGTPGQAVERDPEVPAPSEEVGFNGPLDKLPGDNPLFKRSMRERY